MFSRKNDILPGFRPTMAYTLFYLALIVLIPLGALLYNGSKAGFEGFTNVMKEERVLSAVYVSFGTALTASAINCIFGLVIAWCIARYSFFGKEILDTLIDLPLTLPTAVAGISLTAIYAETGFMGKFLAKFGIKAVFNFTGITIALMFIGLPFIVRTVQPVIMELSKEDEEAASSLGATKFQTFRFVLFPVILPSLISGFGMAFSRCLGEYGSVIFISGNLSFKTEILPLIIVTKLEQYQYQDATVIASFMLLCSLLILGALNILQKKTGTFKANGH